MNINSLLRELAGPREPLRRPRPFCRVRYPRGTPQISASGGTLLGIFAFQVFSSGRDSHYLASLQKKRIDIVHVVSLRPPCVTCEKSPHRCRPRQTAGHHMHQRPHPRPSISGRNSQRSFGIKIGGHSPPHRVRSHYQSSPRQAAIPVTWRPMSLDHPKSRFGGWLTGPRRSPSRPPKNLPMCSRRSRRSWAHFRFLSGTMM